MSTGRTRGPGGGGVRETANARFKRSARMWRWVGLAVAVGLHFLVFAFGPSLSPSAEYLRPGEGGETLETVALPPEVEVPAPPEDIPEPEVPVVEEVAAVPEENVTFEPVELGEELKAEVPPPPARSSKANGALARFRQFAPYMVPPELKNPEEVRRALQREYPPRLVSAGVQGRVMMWFWIDEEGRVRKYEIKQSSGHAALDEAALEVVDRMEFRPARAGTKPVPVIVALPIDFIAP